MPLLQCQTHQTAQQTPRRHSPIISRVRYVEISGNHVRLVAQNAEFANEIDVARAEIALKRATDRVTNPLPGVDSGPALNAMKRAQARLNPANSSTVELSRDAGAGVESVVDC